jgi:hypothetical protein
MIRHEGQGPGRLPADADTSPTLPLEGAETPDPGAEPTVPLEPAGAESTVPLEPAGAPPRPQAAREPGPPPQADPEPGGYIGHEREHSDVDEHSGVDLARLAWLATVGACLIAVAILVLQGYYGYAAVTFAVAASAALNLT